MAEPKINDQFWFDLSGTMVMNGIDNLNKAIDNMTSMIVWGFGIYTASSVFTVEFKKITEGWIMALLLAPYVLFIFAYWRAQVSRAPIPLTFEANAPDDIKQAYKDTFAHKAAALAELKKLTLVTFAFLAVALILAYCLKNDQRQTTLPAAALNGAFGTPASFQMAGKLPPDAPLKMSITACSYDSVKKKENCVPSADTIRAFSSHEGYYFKEIRIDSKVQSLVVKLLYNEDGYAKSLEKKFTKAATDKKPVMTAKP